MKTPQEERLIELGKACFELTKQNKIATIFMCIFFPYTARKLVKVARAMITCLEAGDIGKDEDYGL